MKFINLRPREVALVGYSTLISRESVESNLGRRYDGPFLPCRVEGWRRTWNIGSPNRKFFTRTGTGRLYPKSILNLNVRPDPSSTLNGVIFVLSQDEVEGFDAREWIYHREEVTNWLDGVNVYGGPAYLYVGEARYELNNIRSVEEAAIRSTYLETIEKGLVALGEAFRREYEESSEPVPQNLIIQDERELAAVAG